MSQNCPSPGYTGSGHAGQAHQATAPSGSGGGGSRASAWSWSPSAGSWPTLRSVRNVRSRRTVSISARRARASLLAHETCSCSCRKASSRAGSCARSSSSSARARSRRARASSRSARVVRRASRRAARWSRCDLAACRRSASIRACAVVTVRSARRASAARASRWLVHHCVGLSPAGSPRARAVARLAAAVAQPVVPPYRVTRVELAASARVCRSISSIHVLHMLSEQRVSHTRSV